MIHARAPQLLPVIFAAVTGALAAGLAAQAQIQIVEIPQPLELPLEAGRDAVLLADVTGAEIEEVWLALSANARARITLDALTATRHYLNLADRAVDALLRADPQQREFQLFARTKAGATVASAPVRFTVRLRDARTEPRLVLRGESAEEIRLGGSVWASPCRITELELLTGDTVDDAGVSARIGAERHPFQREDRRRRQVLVLTPELREAWQQAGELTVELRGARGESSLRLRARPDRLRLGGADGAFAVVQRRAGTVPGTNGWLQVRLEDITAGQVLLSVRDGTGNLVVAQRSVVAGDRLEIPLPDGKLHLKVRRLVNLLIGDDQAEFVVAAQPGDEPDAIARLLDRVAAVDVTFLREGEAYDGKAAADHLRRKLRAAGPSIQTVDQFIARIGTRSSTTGHPYRVRLRDGTELDAASWLRSLADG